MLKSFKLKQLASELFVHLVTVTFFFNTCAISFFKIPTMRE